MLAMQKCGECGAEFAAHGTAAACPACLMELGLHRGELPDEAGPVESAETQEARRFQPPKPGELASRFPQLEILDLIGHGGMGAVYKARQVRLDRLVALKVIIPGAVDEPGFAHRFEREARALAKLNHPNVVTVYDFGIVDGVYFLIMEYVSGTNLRQLIHSKELAPESALPMVAEICDALQYAHDQGIVHRDIKPENILVSAQGHVKIADFGLAKLLGNAMQQSALTKTGQVIGTPHYMAPEQLERPLEVDHRADIYSLGVVFYEMLTGELPLGRFNRPSKRVQVNVKLDEVVLRALEKEPERRYQHVSEIGGALKSLDPGGRVPQMLDEPSVYEGVLVNLVILVGTIPLVLFALWWTGSYWVLAGFCLPWLALGASITDRPTLPVWIEAGVCFLFMTGAIAYSVWNSKDGSPLYVLITALVAWCFGCGIGEAEKNKRIEQQREQEGAAKE